MATSAHGFRQTAAWKRPLLIVAGTAVGIAAYLFPYVFMLGEWWRWLPSTLVILIVGAAFHGSSTARFFGLRMSVRATAATAGLFLMLLPICAYVLLDVLNDPPLHIQAYTYRPKYVGQFFQVFNDEIVLRAAVITMLLQWIRYPLAVSLVLAAFFAMGHYLLYSFHGSEIGWEALTTLFLFGAIANLLFIRFGHIGYSLAAHYAWNFYRFNSSYFVSGYEIPQGETFNYVEGNGWVAVIALTAFVLVYILVSRVEHSESMLSLP